MKIALVHDMLVQYGGAEKVLKTLSEIYSNAPIYTLLYDENKMGNIFPKEKIRTSFLQKLPFAKKKYQWYLPLMPQAVESYDLKNFDIVISLSSAFAKGVITAPNTKHLCYCHTPTRYLWINPHDYVKNLPYNNFTKKIIKFYLSKLRIWDQLANNRVDKIIVNSKHTQKRVKKYYRKESEVIYPPVETNNFYISKKKDYFLTGGRLVSYKKFDLIVKAFNRTKKPLKIFGTGPEYKKIKKMAGKNIKFLGFVNDNDLKKLYSEAKAFIHAQEEDFGIILVEAMASGTPIIAYKKGGACETLTEGISGEFFSEQSVEVLANKIQNFNPQKYKPESIKKESEKFDSEIFKNKIKKIIENYENF